VTNPEPRKEDPTQQLRSLRLVPDTLPLGTSSGCPADSVLASNAGGTANVTVSSATATIQTPDGQSALVAWPSLGYSERGWWISNKFAYGGQYYYLIVGPNVYWCLSPTAVDQYQSVAATATTLTGELQIAQATSTAVALEEARQQAQQNAVSNANAQLASALKEMGNDTRLLATDTNLSSVLKAYRETWAKMQVDYQKEQRDAAVKPLSCYQLGTVNYDAGTVNYDLGSIKYHDGSLHYVTVGIDSDIAQVTKDITTMQNAFKALQAEVSANTTGTPPPRFSANDVSTAISASQKQINDSTTALKQAQATATDYDNKAAQLDQTAKAFAAGLKCSG